MAKLNLICIFLIMLLLPYYCICCPEYQKEALLQFKFLLLVNTTLPLKSEMKLNALESWNSSSSSDDCCEWELVECNSKQQVTSLDFYNLILSLALSSNVLAPLFHLQTLTELDIGHNDIHGEIPGVGLANLTNVVQLRMNGNSFNGTIPSQLFSLRHLEHLDMSQNLIEGTLGVQIGNLTKLLELLLSNNKFSGGIPSSLLRLKDLQHLDLSSNLLSKEIPNEIGNLSNIQYLFLKNNNLIGEISPSMQKMEKIVSLTLKNNLLSGEIPTWLFDMNGLVNLNLGLNKFTLKNVSNLVPRNTKISYLSLKSCNISGEIPIWLSNHTNLYSLDLSQNNLQGTFPQWLAQKTMSSLILSSNKLSGSLPPYLFQSDSLEILILSSNNFSGLLPDSVGEASNLDSLMLSDNNFFGPLPSSISNMSKLSSLDLSFNKFSSKQFPIFNQYSLLSYIDLSSNKLSGELTVTFPLNIEVLRLNQNHFSGGLPQNLTNLRLLYYLDLHGNNIVGQVPKFLSRMSSLQILNLRENFLQGPIPVNLSNLTSLQILDLSSNNLNGKIPPTLGNLTGMIKELSLSFITRVYLLHFGKEVPFESNDLEVSWKKLMQGLSGQNLQIYTFLDLSNNQFSGEIPHTLGALKSLKSFNLSNNKLYGRIPMSFGDLQSLESLDLSHNNLSGGIPGTLAKLLELTYLDLSNNKLEGLIPNGPQMDRMNDPNSYANNSGLCGMQIQVPCDDDSKSPPKPKLTERIAKKSKSWENWFSWETAAIGYPSGFFSTILVMYVIGYFNVAPRRGRRRRHVSRNSLFCF